MTFLTFLFFLVNFIRGSSTSKTIFGFNQFDSPSMIAVLIFVIICFYVSFKNTKELIHEQKLKQKYGKGLIKSDFILE